MHTTDRIDKNRRLSSAETVYNILPTYHAGAISRWSVVPGECGAGGKCGGRSVVGEVWLGECGGGSVVGGVCEPPRGGRGAVE